MKIISKPNSILDFAYPPLIYLIYKSIASLTTNPALIQLPTIGADLLSGSLLLKIALQFLDRFRSLLATFAYLFNPILIWISTVYVFDSIAILFMLLAVYFALERRTVPAALSLAFGFNIKLFPLLLTPVFLGRLRKQSSPLHLSAFLLFPLAILLFTIPIIQIMMGLTSDQLLKFYVTYYQNRQSYGFSVWLIIKSLGLGAGSSILLVIAYSLQVMFFLYVTLRTKYLSNHDYISYGLFTLYLVVNLSIQLYPYYLLWFYPFLLLTAFRVTDTKRLIILFTLTGLTYALPSIYIYSRLGLNLANLPVPALGSSLDYLMFFSNQMATWGLALALLHWSKAPMLPSQRVLGARH